MRWQRALRPDLWIPLLAFILRMVPGPRVIDDAYIIFRYAQNLIAGNGLVYNPGEAVFGMTTPLFVLLLSLLALPTGGIAAPFPILALIASAAADAATCWLLIRLGRSIERPTAGILTAAVWAVAPMSVSFAIGGMETSVFILLMIATLYFHSIRRPAAAALAAGLSLTTRPDALLLIALLFLERMRQIWRIRRGDTDYAPFKPVEVAGLLLPGAAWAAYAWLSYGSPIPHSVVAKSSAYFLPPEAGLVRLLQHYATPFLEHLAFGTVWIAFGLILYGLLFSLGAVDTIRRRPETWPIFAYPILYAVAFSAANPLIFRWYLAPPLPTFFLGIFLGVVRVTRDLKRPSIAWAFGAIAVLLSLNGWTLRPSQGPSRPAPDMAFVGLEAVYEEIGREMLGQVEPQEVVAAGDIGALGYFSGARVLDLVGLVSPQVVEYFPLPPEAYVINFAVSTDALLDLSPDWIVMLEVYGRETALKDPRFAEAYTLVKKVPTDLYESDGMLIFRRSGVP